MLASDYFAALQQALAGAAFTRNLEVHFVARTEHIGAVSGKVLFEDQSELHFMEYVSIEGEVVRRLKYRYHYQHANGTTIFRYDNKPHHRDVATFPNHKHVGELEQPAESAAPQLPAVLDEIARSIWQQSITNKE
jgi:hypothetical protein